MTPDEYERIRQTILEALATASEMEHPAKPGLDFPGTPYQRWKAHEATHASIEKSLDRFTEHIRTLEEARIRTEQAFGSPDWADTVNDRLIQLEGNMPLLTKEAEDFEKRLGSLRTDLSKAIDTKFEALEEIYTERVAVLEDRVNQFVGKLGAHNRRLEKLEAEWRKLYEALSNTQDAVDSRLSALEDDAPCPEKPNLSINTSKPGILHAKYRIDPCPLCGAEWEEETDPPFETLSREHEKGCELPFRLEGKT
jgi:DNA repair exonuclease SbcCD ATPase subunit